MAEILILDDDKQFCGMLLQHVQRAGHGVSLAHSLEEGLARTRSTSYDIVFLDVRLPEGSGLDILPELRIGIFPPEVIIVTGFGDAESAELAVQCGAWDYVRKESSVKVMMLSLSRALQYPREPTRCHPVEGVQHARLGGSLATFSERTQRCRPSGRKRCECPHHRRDGNGKGAFCQGHP